MALVSPSADMEGPGAPMDEPARESARCFICSAEVTPVDERCPRCGATVVPADAKPIDALRGNARAVYVMQALALFCGLPAIPGLIVAYANRGAARDTWLDSHYEWQIDTFWGMFYFWLAGIGLVVVGNRLSDLGMLARAPGVLVFLAAAAWYISRLVKGWTRLSDGDPVTDY
jgi:uncharacterized membrane protein